MKLKRINSKYLIEEEKQSKKLHNYDYDYFVH